MAINIFNGSSAGKKPVNTASNSSRAQQAKSALVGESSVSKTGSTAVKSKGILGKVGNTIGKVAGKVSKFLPGIGGTIAKGIKNIFNDPEWWQTIPGDAVTMNVPLVPALQGEYGSKQVYANRAVFLEIISRNDTQYGVISATESMITQYLMPQIRKVVNAVPLQAAADYADVLATQTFLYALWRHLKKIDYMLKHGMTYVPNLDVMSFPVFRVANAAWLQSTIGRLEEYLRANVRLPHTLCEYLAWRFGRIYKTNDSAKAALVMYTPVELTSSINVYDAQISQAMNFISATTARQQANTDLYNTYYDHDLMVEIRDETQCKYDAKEFMLRTNLDLMTGEGTRLRYNNPNPVFIDSELDNPTTFMASTVSTYAQRAQDGLPSVLFPVKTMIVHSKMPSGVVNYKTDGSVSVTDISILVKTPNNVTPSVETGRSFVVGVDGWMHVDLVAYDANLQTENAASMAYASSVLWVAMMAKACEVYNKDILVPVHSLSADSDKHLMFDVTTPSFDMALVDDLVLGNEHVYAFANLVDINRKRSESVQAAEKLVARDVADMLETTDIATVVAK